MLTTTTHIACNTKNLHRIEDGIYPENVLPTMHPTELLNQALSTESPLLTAWFDTKAYIDSKFDVAKMQHDPETRVILIAHESWCDPTVAAFFEERQDRQGCSCFLCT